MTHGIPGDGGEASTGRVVLWSPRYVAFTLHKRIGHSRLGHSKFRSVTTGNYHSLQIARYVVSLAIVKHLKRELKLSYYTPRRRLGG
jgi:hypothetical protein